MSVIFPSFLSSPRWSGYLAYRAFFDWPKTCLATNDRMWCWASLVYFWDVGEYGGIDSSNISNISKLFFKFRKPLWSTFQNFCVFQKKGDTPYCSLFQYYCLLQICFPKYWNTLLIQERWKTLISLTIERLRRLAIVVYWAGHWWVLQQCHLHWLFLAPISYLIGTNPVDKLDKGEQWGLIPALILGPLMRCFSQEGETCS